MAENNFIFRAIATLKKAQTKKQVQSDAKNLGDIKVPLVGTLDKAKTKAQLQQDLKSLNSEVELKGKVNKKDIATSVQQATKQAQTVANKNTVQVNMNLKKDKLINDIKVFGQQNSKMFKDVNMAAKYNSLLDNAKLATSNKEIQNLRLQLSAMRSEIKATNLSGLTLGDTFKKTFKRATELFASTGGIMLLTRQIRQAWTEALNLDSAYTNLVKVQKELTRGDYPEYLEQCNKKAQELATTQKSLIEGATEFSKSGYTQSESDKLTEKSTILSNVGDMSASDSAKAIISGIQAYDIVDGYTEVEKKAEALINKYNEIGNTASITTSEIAQGVQAVGSVFADANTSVDEFIALLAAGNRQYQDANSLALGLRTAALRIRGCSAELEEMGEETEGVYTSASKLQEKIAGLTNINGNGGVQILEADGETFRSIYDIFLDISKVYQDMSDTDQSALLELVAGKHRASAISATFNNMSEAQEIYQRSLNSTGSAQEEYDKYLQSSEASLNRFKASMTETYQSVINGETVKGILNCGNATLQFVNSLGLVESTLKGLVAIGVVKVITTLSTAFKASAVQASNFGTALKMASNIPDGNLLSKYNVLKNIAVASKTLTEAQMKQVLSNKALSASDRIRILRLSGLTKEQAQAKLSQMGLTQSTKAQTVAQNSATVSTFSLTAAITGFGQSLKAAFLNNPVVISIMALTTVIGAVTNQVDKYKEKIEETRQKSTELSNSWKDNNTSLNDTISQYKELNEKLKDSSLSTEEVKSVKEQLTTIQNNLNKAYGDEANSIDLVNGKYDEQIEKLENLSKKKAQDYIAENSGNIKEDKKYLEKIISGNNTTDMIRYDTNLNDKEAEKQYKEAEKIYKKYFEKYNALSLGYDYYKGTTGLRLNLEGTREDIQTQLSSLFAELNEDYTDNPPEFIQGLKDVITETLNMDDFDTTKIEDAKNNVKTYTEAEVLANTKTRNLYNESVEAVEAYNNALSEGKGIDKAKQNLDDIKAKVSEAVKGYEGYDTVFNDIFNAIQKTDSKIAEKTSNVKDTVANAEEIVTKALNNEIMSLSEAKAILAQYSLNLESVTSGEINKLVTEGKVSNNTAQQIALFALKKKLANGTTITTDGDIKNLIALAGVSSKVIQMMYTLDTMKKKIASGLGEAGTAGGKAYLESKAKALEADIKKELNKGNSVNFNVDYSGGTATTDAVNKANKEATKSTTKFSQAIDWCAQTLSKLSKTIDLYSAKLENNTNSVKTQIKYYKELLNAQNNIVKGYAKTESKYKSTYTKALKKLSKSDQKKVKDGTYTIEQFSGTTKKSGKKSKAEKRYNNIQKALEARDNYLDAQTDSVNAKNQLQEYAEDLASVRWDKATEQVEKLNNQVSILDTRMSNVSGYKAKNKVLQEQLDLQKKILTKQENAYENTQSDANAYYKKISSKYKKNKNSDGTIKTSGVKDQTQLKYIKVYNAYVRQLAEDEVKLAQAQEDYTAAVQEAAITRAENIKADYDNKLSLIEAKANELNSEIALAEAKGQVASAEYYKLLSDNSNQRLSELENEKKLLKKQLSSTRAYTDEWYEIKQAVIEVDEAIADETLNAVENINKQIEAMKELTQAKNDYLSGSAGTLDWLEGLTDTDDYYNEDGSFSDKGMAIAKGKIDKVKLYEQQAKNAQENIDSLDAMYANGEIDEATYLNKRIELTEDLQNATKSMYDEQQSLHDMYINGLKEESEALQELIDKKMESLKADKAEYDYQKSIAEKTKNITDLEKQLAMLEGDNSEEARAKRQKVKVELEEAQQDLEDTQYDKYLERLENSLGDLQDRFDAVIEKLDKQGAIPSMEELSALVDSDSASVISGVNQIIKDAGLNDLLGEKGIGGLNATVSDLLTTSTTGITEKITTTNDLLGDIYSAMPSDGTSGNTDTKVSLSDVLGGRNLKNQMKLLAGDAEGKSDLNKYLMSQGYNDMNEKKMLSLVSAILSSEYTSGMNSDTYNKLASITSSEQLTAGKDPNSTDNKNAILEGLKYVRAKEFIANNATKAKYSKDKYGALNKKIYDITGGKVLNDANAIKLANMFNVKDNDKNNAINGDEAKKLVKLLEDAGFSNGGIVEAAVRKNGDDGIGSLQVGEAVLTPVQTTALMELAGKLQPLNNFMDVIQKPNLPAVQSNVGGTSTMIDSVNLEFTLPNVTDKESFMKMFRNESDVRRMIYNSFDSQINSRNKNKKFGANRL